MTDDPTAVHSPDARTSRPTAAERVRDAIALALLAGGVGLFFYARAHLQDLAAGNIVRVPGHSALEQSIHYDRLSRLGLWIAAAGLAAAVLSSLVRRRRTTSSPGQP